MLRLQDDPAYECFYFIADWHMLTTHYDRTDELAAWSRGLVLDWLAAGLDPQKAVIYRQSDLPEVAEMALLLGMTTPLGWLERVPSFKERLRDMAEREVANYGLLGYPVLQAVDIAIVRGELVPVGQDQVAHLELSREIVRRFNGLYGDVLVEPQPLLSETPLIPGSDGRKMSKTLDNYHRACATIPTPCARRVRSFITDPLKVRRGDPGRPEICPVFALHEHFSPLDVDRIEAHVSHGRAGLRRLQDPARRSPDRDVRSLPRTPRGAGVASPGSRTRCSPAGLDRVASRGAGDPRSRALGDGARMTRGAGRADAGASPCDLPVYQGPFRLLADLIVEQKIDVCDVAVATITDRYLAHAADAQRWNLEEATWFLAICAVLLELKVGRLMPRHTEPDEEDILGPSPDLAYARSLELAAFRRVAVELARRLEDEAGYFARDVGPGPGVRPPVPGPHGAARRPRTSPRLAAQLLRPPPTLDLSHVTPDPLHDGRGHHGTGGPDVRRSGTGATFRDLVADCEERIHVVVRFLAILELYREGKVELQQAPTFGEIEVEWTGRVVRADGGPEARTPGPTATPGPSRRCSSCRTSRSPRPCSRRPSTWTVARSRPCATGWRHGCEDRGSGLVLRNIAGGWRLYTHPDTAAVVEQFVLSSRQARLTKAALETLADRRLQAAGHPPPGELGPRRELRRRPAGPGRPRAGRGGGARGGARAGRSCTPPRRDSSSDSGLPSLAALPSLAPAAGVAERRSRRRPSAWRTRRRRTAPTSPDEPLDEPGTNRRTTPPRSLDRAAAARAGPGRVRVAAGVRGAHRGAAG